MSEPSDYTLRMQDIKKRVEHMRYDTYKPLPHIDRQYLYDTVKRLEEENAKLKSLISRIRK